MDLDLLALDGCHDAMLSPARPDLDLVGSSWNHPGPKFDSLFAAGSVEFPATQLASLVKENFGRKNRIGPVLRIGQIEFVIESKAVFQYLYLIQMWAEPDFTEEQDSGFD